MKQHDIIIAGGGIIGMLTARELAEAGASVTLIERGGTASEASWAGGGIVSPLYPWRYDEAITALAGWSQQRYRALCQELHAETGIDPQFRDTGLLILSVEDKAAAQAWAEATGQPLTEIGAETLYRLEPNLPPGIDSALWMPEVASVRNPRLGQALSASLRAHPRVTLVQNSAIQGWVRQGERIAAVKTSQGELAGDRFLVAAGAWSGDLLADLGLSLPIEPVRGQMLLFEADPGLLQRVVLRDGRYLIPRRDGHILAGSTLELTGFDKLPTRDAYDSLYASAVKIMPALANCPVIAQWAGLRPGAPGGIPFIDQVAPYENLFINAGHFRNGLVLAPAAARLGADLLLGRQPILNPAPYRLAASRPESLT